MRVWLRIDQRNRSNKVPGKQVTNNNNRLLLENCRGNFGPREKLMVQQTNIRSSQTKKLQEGEGEYLLRNDHVFMQSDNL